MALVDHGVQVTNSRQWAYALSPNATGTGWNFITSAYNYPTTNPVEWVIIKNLTTAPTQTITTTTTGQYANSLVVPNSGRVSTRAPNGKIIFPLLLNSFVVYDPTTESVSKIGPFVESPPINPNVSTIPYSWCFDSAGMMYFATQESENRPSCVVSLDPNTLAITILGYVGDSATAGTTYGYYCVADTATAKKFLYVAFGQSPWQLWCIDLTPGGTYGTCTKLYSNPGATFISFQEIVGKGYTVNIQGTNVAYWCLDGALYPYTVGVAPPGGLARSVTPASNPLPAGAPQIDASTGIGLVGWRPSGSSGAYTYVPYTVNYTSPIPIESLVASNDGVVGNTQQYNGFFTLNSSGARTWFGAATGIVSGGPRLNIGNKVYITGYPNGPLFSYDTTQPWQASVNNPVFLGTYAPNTTLSGIKYANYFGWSPQLNRLYVNGDQERSRLGMGVGWYDAAKGTFGGTYSLPGMDSYNTTGMVVDDRADQVISAATPLSGSGDGVLMCCNRTLTTITKRTPFPGITNLGQIYPGTNSGDVVGLVTVNGKTVAYCYNVVKGVMSGYHIVQGVTGTIGPSTQRYDNSLWYVVGNTLVKMDPNTLAVSQVTDVSAAAPVTLISFGSDNVTMYFAGGPVGANLYSGVVATIPPTSALAARGVWPLRRRHYY